MKILFLASYFLILTISAFAQSDSNEEKYEYVAIIQNQLPFQPRTLEIVYSDGTTEKFADLITLDAGKNYNKNIATLLKAINYLGSKGYELIYDSSENKNILTSDSEFILRRKYR